MNRLWILLQERRSHRVLCFQEASCLHPSGNFRWTLESWCCLTLLSTSRWMFYLGCFTLLLLFSNIFIHIKRWYVWLNYENNKSSSDCEVLSVFVLATSLTNSHIYLKVLDWIVLCAYVLSKELVSYGEQSCFVIHMTDLMQWDKTLLLLLSTCMDVN